MRSTLPANARDQLRLWHPSSGVQKLSTSHHEPHLATSREKRICLPSTRGNCRAIKVQRVRRAHAIATGGPWGTDCCVRRPERGTAFWPRRGTASTTRGAGHEDAATGEQLPDRRVSLPADFNRRSPEPAWSRTPVLQRALKKNIK